MNAPQKTIMNANLFSRLFDRLDRLRSRVVSRLASDAVLEALSFPIALAAQPLVGYSIRPELLANVCNRYHQVVAVNLTGVNDGYFLRLKDALRRDVGLYVPVAGAVYGLEIIVVLVQAYVFTLLSALYIAGSLAQDH